MHAVYAPIREFPATHPYCCTVAVLEWNSGHIIVLPPVAKLEPSIFHYYCSSAFLVCLYWQFYKYFHMDGIGKFPNVHTPNEKTRHIDGAAPSPVMTDR